MKFAGLEEPSTKESYSPRPNKSNDLFCESVAGGGIALIGQGLYENMLSSCIAGGIMMIPVTIKGGHYISRSIARGYGSVAQGYKNILMARKIKKLDELRAKKTAERMERSGLATTCTD